MPPAGEMWNTLDVDVARRYPAEDYLSGDTRRLLRAVEVAAPRTTTYRWLCQLTVAPYSYDLLDNLGRRSPRTLTPGSDRLAEGQRFLVFRIRAFESDQHISGVSTTGFSAIYGQLAVSYTVQDGPGGSSRIVVCLVAKAGSWTGRIRRRLLAIGDVVMMRKQLRTLRRLAESTPEAQGGAR